MDVANELAVLDRLRWAFSELMLVLIDDMEGSYKQNKSGISADNRQHVADLVGSG
jgi:hypothetical protein